MTWDFDTPALVIDLDVLEANLDAMAAVTRAAGVTLRPHVKTHKCPEIARLQLERGAVGVSVATVGEADVFAEHGIDDLFVAYPVWASAERGDRIARLMERCHVSVGVDSADAAEALGRATRGGAVTLRVLIEVDSGHHRSGVLPDATVAVATAAARAGLEVHGIFTFPGHSYAPGASRAAAIDERQGLERARDALDAAGVELAVVSGGSTPTAQMTVADPGPVTELRPGVYAFNDAQQLALGTCTIEEVALTAHGTVVSAPAPDRVVLDTGSKVLGADHPAFMEGYGEVVGVAQASVTQLSEHHAVVTLPGGAPRPAVGDRLRVVPTHCCNAVNLADHLVVTRGADTVGRLAVAARGANA